jgi:general secretion pathway protein I
MPSISQAQGKSVFRARPDAGFSLIEALVALAVFATAAIALVVMQTQTVRSAQAQQARSLATLVAQNLLVETAAAYAPAPLGVRTGETELAGRRWIWRADVTTTLDAGVHRLRVTVRAAGDEQEAARLDAFIASGGAS